MTNDMFNTFNEQMEKMVMDPMRAYASLGLDHAEKLFGMQLDAARAYTDLGLKQARTTMAIKDPKDIESYMQGQQEFAKTVTERVKGDTEKVVSLNREFAEKAQKLVQDNVAGFQKVAQQ